MKKHILPLLLLLMPFAYFAVSIYIAQNQTGGTGSLLPFLLIWIFLFLVFFVSGVAFVSIKVIRKEKSGFFLLWNMVLKLCHIPIYILIFLFAMIFVVSSGGIGIVLVPIFMVFDYMLLIVTSIYGIGGIVQAKREGFLSTGAAAALGILSFFFCADVICSIVAFCNVKVKQRKQRITDLAIQSEI